MQHGMASDVAHCKCLLRSWTHLLSGRLNVLLQKRHLTRSWVWVNSCRFKSNFRLQTLSQWLHSNFFDDALAWVRLGRILPCTLAGARLGFAILAGLLLVCWTFRGTFRWCWSRWFGTLIWWHLRCLWVAIDETTAIMWFRVNRSAGVPTGSSTDAPCTSESSFAENRKIIVKVSTVKTTAILILMQLTFFLFDHWWPIYFNDHGGLKLIGIISVIGIIGELNYGLISVIDFVLDQFGLNIL